MQKPDSQMHVLEFNVTSAIIARTPLGQSIADVAFRSSDCSWGTPLIRSVQDSPMIEGHFDISQQALRRLESDSQSLLDVLAQFATPRLSGGHVARGREGAGRLKERKTQGKILLGGDDTKSGEAASAGTVALACIRNASNRAAVSTLLEKAVHRGASTGETSAHVLADLASAATTLAASPGSAFFLIVDPVTATRLALKVAGGGLAFPEVSLNGGQIGAAFRVFVVDPELLPTPGDGSRIALLVDAAGLLVDRGRVGIARREPSSEVSLGLSAVRTFGLDQFRPAVALIVGVHW